ncbi:thioredoxin-like protein [Dyadobacter jejuensis]|uniref:Thioredoxin-like protein n=1 Tax=Dyadobacter jejuensis TaxID=1082580 RepID=A0A316AQC0_9BACT|nr:thioredoxin family protein [Dyadobacter jejuensis]PWJ59935.1 thioredoxin-like protein [Dyadobacter jejuensis]
MSTSLRNIEHLLTDTVVSQAYSYIDYVAIMERVVKAGLTTGPVQSEELSHYTRLNLSRMQRIYKTTKLQPELVEAIKEIKEPQTWFVLTEAWCGDAAQNIPVLALLAEQNPLVELKLLLRDEHLELMDQYLTHGGRSIPKLIAVDAENNELFTWGPRPQGTQELFMAYKADPAMGHAAFAEQIQRWYIADKSMSLQAELHALLLQELV